MEPVKRKAKDKNEYVSMLWSRDVASVKSKLGSFLSAFCSFFDEEDKDPETEECQYMDTDNWLGHKILFTSWKAKNRAVEVVE